MGTVGYYRLEAKRCRELAAKSSAAVKQHWLEIADEYDQLAEAVEVRAPRTGLVQTQPMQQQQQKKG